MSDRPPAAPIVRAADRVDLPALAEVFVAAWHGGYRGVIPDGVIDAMDVRTAAAELSPSLAAADRTTLVALDATGQIIGFTIFGPDRDRHAGCHPTGCHPTGYLHAGYLASLYVSRRPAAGGHGVGSSLLRAAIDAMPRVDVTLWVFAGNVRARRLYERAGFRPDGAELTDPRWRAVQVRYRRVGSPGMDTR